MFASRSVFTFPAFGELEEEDVEVVGASAKEMLIVIAATVNMHR